MELKEMMEHLKTNLTEAREEMKSLVEQQSAELKEQGATTSETAKKITATDEKMAGIAKELAEVKSRIDEVEKQKGRLEVGQDRAEAKTLGERFIESEAFKNFDLNRDGKSAKFELPSLHQTKTITGESLGDVPGYLYEAQRVAGIINNPERRDRVRDLFNVRQTTSGAIEFVRETNFTNRASTVPEFTADENGDPHATHTEKPRSSLEFDIVTESVKTIAHWMAATRQIIADATQLRSYIDGRLIYGLKLAEDQQLLYGSGTGEDLQGIMTTPGVQSYTQQAGDTKIDAIRRAITLATVAEYPVTGIVVNPNDWEDIELLKDNEGRYIWTTVTIGGEKRLWRVPVVETVAIAESNFLLGAFGLGADIWDRQQSGIRVTDSHKDFFTKNLWAILAEERLALTTYRPEAFVVGEFITDDS